MFIEIVLVLIVGLALMALIVGVALGALFLTSGAAVYFSRIAFSLLLAAGLKVDWFSSGALNYWVTVAMIFGVICLLSLMPRVNMAIKFFCTSFITYIVVVAICGLGISIYNGIAGAEVEIGLVVDIITKIVTAIVCFFGLLKQMDNGVSGIHSTNPVYVMIQRILASLVYGLTVVILGASAVNGAYMVPEWGQWLLFLGGSAVFFGLDFLLLGDAVN